ncbi:MAG: hypothetical protein WD598_04170 [Acidimicrobiia bacterium]
MNIAVLVKQISGEGGPSMDSLSRRAVAQGAELAAAVGDGVCTAVTLGPPEAEDVVREAAAWGRICSVMTFGVLIIDPQVDGADGLAPAQTIAQALRREGPFDLVLLGARAEDGGTGLLGPQVGELLDLPFVDSARYLSMQATSIHVRAEQGDGWLQATVELPAVVSCAAGLIDPCEASPAARDLVPRERIRTISTADLGPAPPGLEVAQAPKTSSGPIAVVGEPGRPDVTAALLAVGADRASTAGRQVVAITTTDATDALSADEIVYVSGDVQPEDVAHAVAEWSLGTSPSAVLAPDTAWGREVAGRVAVRLGTMAPITTIDPPSGSALPARELVTPRLMTITVRPRNRVRVVSRTRRTA